MDYIGRASPALDKSTCAPPYCGDDATPVQPSTEPHMSTAVDAARERLVT